MCGVLCSTGRLRLQVFRFEKVEQYNAKMGAIRMMKHVADLESFSLSANSRTFHFWRPNKFIPMEAGARPTARGSLPLRLRRLQESGPRLQHPTRTLRCVPRASLLMAPHCSQSSGSVWRLVARHATNPNGVFVLEAWVGT